MQLTASAMACRQKCRRQFWYKYLLRWRKDRTAMPLRMGSAIHAGLEAWELNPERKTNSEAAKAQAVAVATRDYQTCPHWANPYDWRIEAAVVTAMICGYCWYYTNDDLEYLEVEKQFDLPLMHPVSGDVHAFSLAGMIDSIVQRGNTTPVFETKTTSSDISPESDYWLRLEQDSQISLYVLAARMLGYNAPCAIYNVLRKPSFGPAKIPVRDVDGYKIVLDRDGVRVLNKTGSPRQSASVKDGYELQTEPEEPEEYGARILDDIGKQPDKYFARREIPRLDNDLLEYQIDLWHQADEIATAIENDWHYRTVSFHTCKYCDFTEICLSNTTVDPDQPPEGFVKLDDVHPELSLKGASNHDTNCTNKNNSPA